MHHSRVLRFDGLRSPLTEGWTTGVARRDWGISELTPAVEEILRDTAISAGIGHLVQEASVFTMRVSGFKDAISGQRQDVGAVNLEQLGERISMYKSIYRTLFVDRNDEATRVNATFAGLPDLLDRSAGRLAAIADIPQTRFMGRSPAGLNATGDSDLKNYGMRVAALQTRLLRQPLKLLDQVLAKHAGIKGDVPEYEWLPLVTQSEEEQAKAVKAFTESVMAALAAGAIDEVEARERLSKVEFCGELGPWTPPVLPGIEAEEEAERQRQAAEAAAAAPAAGVPAAGGPPVAGGSGSGGGGT